MQYKPLKPSESLLPELRAELERIRSVRAFNAAGWLAKKTALIGDYFTKHGLKGAVLGLSGGVDSAVVLGILLEVRRRHPEVLKEIVVLCLPVSNAWATDHDKATLRVINQCRVWDVEYRVINLSAIHTAVRNVFSPTTDWANGQLVSNLRTPFLYHQATVLTAAGTPSLVIGTTNRDEGAYLGYVGKASDGMVDLQVIADLHKSEVYAVARHLGVTQEILDIAPTGDMYDGRVDEEVFGAPYDFVELYLSNLCHKHVYRTQKTWSQEAQDQYLRFRANLEALHRYNSHKYLVGSPAVHLNVLESAVPGGWNG